LEFGNRSQGGTNLSFPHVYPTKIFEYKFGGNPHFLDQWMPDLSIRA